MESRDAEYILFDAIEEDRHSEVTGAVWPRHVIAGSESDMFWARLLESHIDLALPLYRFSHSRPTLQKDFVKEDATA